MYNKRIMFAFSTIIILLLVLFFVSLNVGSISVSVSQLFRGLFIEYDKNVATIYDLRFPRIFVAMFAGAAIAVSGVLFQAVMKNPLADPTIIGVSSGASCVALIITAWFPSLYYSMPLLSCFGGILAFCLVYSLSWKRGLQPLRMILVGVAVNAVFTAFIDVIDSVGGTNSSVANIVNANITMKTWSDVKLLAVYVMIGLLFAVCCSSSCNLLALEDKTAKSIGINVSRLRMIISIIAVILASISTAIVGVIGFLGLIVPHIARVIVGSNHKVLIPFSTLFGASLLLFADTVGRVICAPYEISAAIIMSVIGGPFFIILLRKSKRF